jgi:uncharacterized protein YndB with AHSA1/START domain
VSAGLDPALDLRIERVIRAPRARVWKAWTGPQDLARWWLPAPTQCRLERAGALVLGRRTYEAFAEAWPRMTDPDDPSRRA